MTKPTGNPTGRPKGQAKTGGRRKGTPNRTSQLLKDAVLQAAEIQGNKINKDKQLSGLIKYLQFIAAEHPAQFCTLLNRVMPLQIGGEQDIGEGINITINFTPSVRSAPDAPMKTIGDEKVEPIKAKFRKVGG